ncbi:multidrug effflux MFS transporter [Flavitalea sp. BT771]|uniref:multidrug effflux MFS transporter n=1 Tax=Flavitalea sp. BT771 TaxID=3063329 RepID=UPI0026E442A0|nr:multidrug effflux MFS transporter [Flavitalea sp. BT771]MDO6435305.1 multidrug effflux MFS transporter [Flavitalea sp. BT771]MDV6224335.1 multidrug effflux MFS transporter [Flavitalea sp. BT771]
MSAPKKNPAFIILILGVLSAIGPFSIDMYLPGFPDIAKDLKTTVAEVALSLSSFFIGISAGQFLYGPLLDRFGRKKPLYAGIALYLVASALCAMARTVELLIILRLFQALGACACLVASRALVRDLFPVDQNARVFSQLMLVIAVSPIIAPTLGGYLAAGLGWKYIFVVLTIIAAFILTAVHFALPEGRPPDKQMSLKPGPIISGFLNVLKEPQFYTYAFTGAIASAGLYAYIAGSPAVFMELFRVTERQYGWIFAVVALGLIGCSQLNSLLLKTYKSQQIIRVALICQSLIAVALFTGSFLGWWGLFSTITLCFLFLCCQGCVFPNSSALSLALFGRNAGTASALMGGVQMSIGALASAIVSFLNNHTALPMTGVMACCPLIALMVLLTGDRNIRRLSSAANTLKGLSITPTGLENLQNGDN